MKKIILIFAVVCSTSLMTHATTPTFKSDGATSCMSEAMRMADNDLANGRITSGQYFGRVNYYLSKCALSV